MIQGTRIHSGLTGKTNIYHKDNSNFSPQGKKNSYSLHYGSSREMIERFYQGPQDVLKNGD
jgi:hypothetical protein